MIDIENLLNPISEDSPSGVNIRLDAGDTTFRDVEEKRREEDAAVAASGEAKYADWPGVVRLCSEALEKKSKDLQLAAYLSEALARTEGFPGLHAGLSVTRQILFKYWYLLHPGYEDDEIIPPLRAKWLSWMGTSRDFLDAVKSISITSGPGIEAYGWGDYEGSQRVDDAGILADQSLFNELTAAGHITGEQWRAAVGGTPRDHLGLVLNSLRGCEEELGQLKSLCEDKFGDDAPNLIELSTLLWDAREYVEKTIAGDAPQEGAEASAEGGGGASGSAGAAPAASAGPISSRDEAYRRLREVAEYLRRTEPHSPVSFLVERAIGWGQMPFQAVIKDVLKANGPAYAAVLETLGIHEEK